MTRVGVLGAGGRMGRAVIAAIERDKSLILGGAFEHDDYPGDVGAKTETTKFASDLDALSQASDALIDFTAPAALFAHLAAATRGGTAIVVGTTGLAAEHFAAIDRAAAAIAVLQTANTSVGATVLARVVAMAATQLPGWDIEILDLHHRDKRDAPSGTALMLGEAAARARGTTLAAVSVPDRRSVRVHGTIGFAALRGGSAAGDHMVLLAGDGERIELHHRAESRDIFATGAVRAATWLARQPPGRYTMADVLAG